MCSFELKEAYLKKDDKNILKKKIEWVKNNMHKVEGTGSVRGIYTATAAKR